jgi:Flp pilus assembly protein TadB
MEPIRLVVVTIGFLVFLVCVLGIGLTLIPVIWGGSLIALGVWYYVKGRKDRNNADDLDD